MRKKTSLVTVLALSLAVVVLVAAAAPAFAGNEKKSNTRTFYYTSSHVALQLPPPGGAVAGHPTDLMFVAYDSAKQSGGSDALDVYVWASNMNSYLPVAEISDRSPSENPNFEFFKTMWNGSPVYLESNGVVVRNNLKTVENDQLNVWMDDGVRDSAYGNRYAKGCTSFIVNLTVPIAIDFTGLPSALGSSFTLPPMTLRFIKISDESFSESSTFSMPGSGFTLQTLHTVVPAWVSVQIPTWLGTGRREVVGTILENGIEGVTPPA